MFYTTFVNFIQISVAVNFYHFLKNIFVFGSLSVFVGHVVA
jgi:hypothetical protein